jgi:hypothetical protein
MKLIIGAILISFLTACSSTPTKFPEEQGVVCYKTEEQEKEQKSTCLRVNSFPDPHKWHRVKEYHVLPGIPDINN